MKTLRAEGSIQTSERLHYLDWLRVLAVVGVFYAHSINIFDMLYWHVRSGGQRSGLIVLVVFGTQWGMSLFFFLAGASAWFALKSRTSGHFIGERFKRLIIPFIVGFILLSPPQAYLFALNQGTYHGSFLQFIPYFFENIQISWNPQWIAAYGYHLWFLAFLFFVSLLTLPVLLLLRRKRGLDFIGWLAAFCSNSAGLFVFVIPIALIQIALRAPFPGYQGWADFFIWLIVYVYGFMLLADKRFTAAILKQGKLALLVTVVCLLIMLIANFAGVLSSWDNITSYTPGYVLYQMLRSLTTWSLMIFILYFGMRCLNFKNTQIDYANEAVLPFYVLHHPVIVVIAFYTIPWDISLGIKFFLVSTAALIVTLLIFEFLIRRWNFTRVLFGLKPLASHDVDNDNQSPTEHPTLSEPLHT
jgi:glucans biosynthesis protein C